MGSDLFLLSEEQMARLAPLLPRHTRGVARVDDRRVISGIVHVLRCGCRGVDTPAEYGPRKTLYNPFVRWAARGCGRRCFRRWPSRRTAKGGAARQFDVEGASLRRRRKGGAQPGGRDQPWRAHHQVARAERRVGRPRAFC